MVSLEEYRRKRRLRESPEPLAKAAARGGNRFVVQKHAARRLHYDFRLEVDGVLKSWAVPKGPSLNPADKRLAVQVEDHPLDYASFEGVIPEGHYGAGEVIVWDCGTFDVEGSLPASEQIKRGELKFILHGQKLRGSFVLVKLRRAEKGNEWLLIKHKDAAADPRWNIAEHDGSVASGRTLSDIAEGRPPSEVQRPLRPAELEGARKAAMPARIEPALATLVERPFSHRDWLFEIKWDGVRALAWLKNGRLELRSRTGRIITAEYPELAILPKRLAARQAILDGEIVVLDEKGHSSFERLQGRMNVSHPSSALRQQAPPTYYVFDLLYCNGYDLRGVPLVERKRLLQQILEPCHLIRYSDHQLEQGRELFELAREQGLEGIVGKQLRSPYPRGRSPLWVKFKLTRELDAVVGGWTAPRGSREHFGALLVGLYAGKKLRFIGGVGSGFTERSQKEVFERVAMLQSNHCPFEAVPETKEKAWWVKPALVARVKYASWTEERRLRAPIFLGLRKDRAPQECRFEEETPAKAEPVEGLRAPAVAERALARKEEVERELYRGRAENVALELDARRVRLTHLNKVFFPESHYTKRDLLAYYYRMADYILPFLKDRPLVLRRYPDGITGESFFQKEAGETAPEWMKTVTIYSDERKAEMEYFTAGDRAALLYLTNLGCIDHNPWSSRADDLDHPDYVFFDLDPTEGTRFATAVAVARAVHQRLESLKLTGFIKTSGATGLHLYVPLDRRYTYEQVRAFAEIVGRLLAAEHPDKITLERSVRKRPRGKVLLDAAQNALGKPLAAVYSLRAFPKAPVSAPLAPAELRASLRPEQWNIRSIVARVEKQGDLWAEFWKKRQGLEEATRLLGEQVEARRRKA